MKVDYQVKSLLIFGFLFGLGKHRQKSGKKNVEIGTNMFKTNRVVGETWAELSLAHRQER